MGVATYSFPHFSQGVKTASNLRPVTCTVHSAFVTGDQIDDVFPRHTHPTLDAVNQAECSQS